MSTFTIDSDNNITAHVELPAGADESQSFSTEKELAKLTMAWPVSRLIDTWNSFAGVAPFDDLKPVRKFTSRNSAVARIWKAAERLSPSVAQPVATGAPKKARGNKSPTKGKRHATARPKAAVARDTSKKADVIDLLRRKQGGTLAEIMEITGWQAHTVRGFVSGTLNSKLGLKIDSFRGEDKERTYRITG